MHASQMMLSMESHIVVAQVFQVLREKRLVKWDAERHVCADHRGLSPEPVCVPSRLGGIEQWV